MFKFLFLIFAVMCLTSFAQSGKTPKAILVDEFETATNGFVKMKMDSFFAELSNNPEAQAFVFNFGTDREIARREKQLRNAIKFRKYDASRLTFVKVGFREKIKTELWLVPPGQEPPKIESLPKLFDEFGKLNNGDIEARSDYFLAELQNHPGKKGYVVLTGSAKEVSRRERFMRIYILNRGFDTSRINFVKDGYSDEIYTGLWIGL